jgi:glycosyltransferase involved in cell wall biosynthesis
MENGVVNLANHLPPEKIQSHIICLEHAGAFAQRLQPKTVVTSLGRRPGWDWRACWRLATAWNRQPPEVIHTHNLGPLIYAVVARMLVPSLWRVPILHGEHGALQGDSLSPRRLRQRKLLYRFCRKVHTVSEGLRHELIALGFPAQKIITLLNGVDCERFVPATDVTHVRQTIGLPQKAWIIGCVGRFIATKRYPLLIQAFEKLADHHPQLLLIILGDGGPEKAKVADMISKSPFNRRILALGHQPDPSPFYQAMDLMVMPSSHEGLANALLEAMACGVPVLAHAACGASEVIADGSSGVLHHIQEASDLATAIGQLIDHPHHLTSMGQTARASAVSRFSLPSMMSNYLRAYQSCAGKPLNQ